MPLHDDDGPRLAEIGRILNDFRLEVRSGLAQMVRQDVYAANLQNIATKFDIQEAWMKRLESDIIDSRNEKRTMRNLMLGGLITTITSLIILAVSLWVKS